MGMHQCYEGESAIRSLAERQLRSSHLPVIDIVSLQCHRSTVIHVLYVVVLAGQEIRVDGRQRGTRIEGAVAIRVELQPSILVAEVEPNVAGLVGGARGVEGCEVGNDPRVCFDGTVAAFAVDRSREGGAEKRK